ncbi:MAG: hypothetical protein MUE44_20875 [Oscillatoriaceae cyanobacterium Prado104]|jgi:predicted transposase/invertase (TIGR01784 family)|nr:hypothetical protein [Oscillatoriaceae cyanobacterium Prado104]
MAEVPAIHQAFVVAQQSKLSRKELEILEKRQMFLHDNRNAILKARQEGLQEGEKRKALESARSLLDVLDVETMARKTGLAAADVQRLRE